MTAHFIAAAMIAYASVFCAGNGNIDVSKEETQKPVPANPATPTTVADLYQTLTLNNTYADYQITSSGQKVFLSVALTSGKLYEFNWNDAYSGDGSKTLDIFSKLTSTDGSITYTQADSAYSTPMTFTPTVSGNYTLEIRAYFINNTGTFAVKGREKPVPATENIALNANDTYVQSTLDSDLNNRDVWTLSVTNGDVIHFNWNDSFSGNGTQTADIKVMFSRPNSTIISQNNDSAYASPYVLTADFTGVLTITVDPWNVADLSVTPKTYQLKAKKIITPAYTVLENSLTTQYTNLTNINSLAQGSNNYVITQALLDEITAFNTTIAQIDTSFPNFLALMDKVNLFMLNLNSYFYGVEKQAGVIVAQIDTLYPSILAALPLAAQQAYLDNIKNMIAAQVSYPTDAEAGAFNNKLYLWNTFGNIYAQNLFYNVNKVATENMINDLLNNATGNIYTDSFALNSVISPSLPYMTAAQANLSAQKLWQAIGQHYNMTYQPPIPSTANSLLYAQITIALSNMGTAVAFVTDSALQDQVITAATAKIFNSTSQTNGTGELNINRRLNFMSDLIGVVIKHNSKSSAALSTLINSFNFGALNVTEADFGTSLSLVNSASNAGFENNPFSVNLILIYINILKNLGQFNGLSVADQNTLNQFLIDGENWLKSINASWTLSNNLLTQNGFEGFGPRASQLFANIRQ